MATGSDVQSSSLRHGASFDLLPVLTLQCFFIPTDVSHLPVLAQPFEKCRLADRAQMVTRATLVSLGQPEGSGAIRPAEGR